MNFGKISAIFFILFCLSIIVGCLVKFSGKSGEGYLLGIFLLFGPLVSFLFGIVGLIFDRDKTIALLSVALSAIPTWFLSAPFIIQHYRISRW